MLQKCCRNMRSGYKQRKLETKRAVVSFSNLNRMKTLTPVVQIGANHICSGSIQSTHIVPITCCLSEMVRLGLRLLSRCTLQQKCGAAFFPCCFSSPCILVSLTEQWVWLFFSPPATARLEWNGHYYDRISQYAADNASLRPDRRTQWPFNAVQSDHQVHWFFRVDDEVTRGLRGLMLDTCQQLLNLRPRLVKK